MQNLELMTQRRHRPEEHVARYVAEEKRVNLSGLAAPGVDPVYIDARQISRVLANLVNNALRHTPAGGRVMLHGYPSRGGVVVEVSFEVATDGTVTVAAPVVFPTVVDKGNTFEIKDILRNLARTDLTPRERAFYEASLARTAEWVGAFIAPAPVG